ncbi:MAG TPA: hypothetical protein VK614_05010 [Allosphingosinicella sp.]|nr:hypothetical protein [Allosphingosinicella sp.]
MRNIVFWIVALIAILWNLFGAYNFAQTLANNHDYLKDVDAEFLAWTLALPGWRYALWGLAVALSVAGSLALLLKRAMAGLLFWLTAGAMVLGFGADFLLFDGMRYYHPSGLGFLAMLVAIEAAFALYAGWAARQGMLKRP